MLAAQQKTIHVQCVCEMEKILAQWDNLQSRI